MGPRPLQWKSTVLTPGPPRKALLTALLGRPEERVTATPKSKHERSASRNPEPGSSPPREHCGLSSSAGRGHHEAGAAAPPRCGVRWLPPSPRQERPQSLQERPGQSTGTPGQRPWSCEGHLTDDRALAGVMPLKRLPGERTRVPHTGVTTGVLLGGTQSEEPDRKKEAGARARWRRLGVRVPPLAERTSSLRFCF